MLVISHRAELAFRADRVVELDRGRVRETAPA
jgi:ABC-type transport system involved in cytochrome bd biosynthesis fused ATPase/permease subunit